MFAFNPIGSPEPMELIVLVIIGLLIIWPFCRIVRKAGFPPLLGLLIIVPLGNIALLLFLAFADWPALRQIKGQEPP